MGKMLRKAGSFGKVLADIQARDKTLWQKIKDWFLEIADKLKKAADAYRGMKPDSVEGRMVREMDEVFDEIQKLFAEGLVEASENFAAAEGNKKTTREGGKLSIRWTQKMTWEEQVNGALYQGKNIRRSDTLVVGKVAYYLAGDGVSDKPLAIPLGVLSKASSGKDISHSIKRGKLAKLDSGIKNAPLIVKNPDRNALVYITDIKQGGAPILVSFEMDTVFDGDSVHKATSIHLQIDVNEYLQNLPQTSTIYIKNKNELEAVGATNNLRGLAANIKFIGDMVTHKKPEVNPESTEKRSDREYLAAVESGDMATAQRMVDEAAKQWGAFLNNAEANEVFKQNGEVRIFYHGTNTGDFTTFDKSLLGSSSGDMGWFGKGFYFAYSYAEAAAYGGRIINAYLKMQNPYDYSQLFKFKESNYVSDRYARFAWLYNVVKQFPDIVEGQKVYAYPNDAEDGSVVTWKQLARWMDGIEQKAQFSVEQVETPYGEIAWELRANPKQESFTDEDGETFTWTEYGMRQQFATEQEAREPINQIGAYLANVMGVESIPRRSIEKIDFSGAVQRAGYDGIIQSPSGDEAVVFDSNQIKSAEAVTYDDAGNVIPLSERFDTTKADIRYSDRDSSGNILTQEQQEYFRDSVVRDKNGRLLVMYHGTPNGGFTKFRSGTYFTQNPEYADVYQNPGASSISTKKNADAPMTYQVYLDIKKPFDTRNAKERKIFQSEFYRKYGTGTPLADSGLPDWVDGMDLQEFIEEMEYDYDGLILDEGGVGGYGDDVKSRGLSYVVFNSEQVKDVGNKKPTSDSDYRYSERDTMVAELERQNAALQEDVEELKKLLALQGTVTGGRIPKKSSVEAAAKWLKGYAGATMDADDMKTLTGMLTEFYGAILNDDELAWESVAEKAAPIADYLQARVNVKPQISEYSKDVLRELRGRKIKLSDSQKAEAARAYGSYNDYRKAAFGSVTLSNEGIPLDSLWQEMASIFPGTFDENVTAGDQPMALLDVIQGLRSTDQSGKGMRKGLVAAVSRGTLRKVAMGPYPPPTSPPDWPGIRQGSIPRLRRTKGPLV